MSNDHKDSGWRKRQIALDIKAENARELGLDYEPSIIEMAKQVGYPIQHPEWQKATEEFAALVEAAARADEREACAKVVESHGTWFTTETVAAAIRARGAT